MRFWNSRLSRCAVLAAVLAAVAANGALAGPKAGRLLTDDQASDVQRALDEGRLIDAGALIDLAKGAGSGDPRLRIFTGELALRRSSFDAALQEFRAVEREPATAAAALQGEGLALARMGRSNEAAEALQAAVAKDPKAWRAWNALGAELDDRKDWPGAAGAYEHALEVSGGNPIVLNNRGYSRLLQGRLQEAMDDFVAALARKPDLAEARTNLRLALALGGDYARAVAGGDRDERAALLNNAGFAAGVRGDYAKAETLLQDAMNARTQFYERASENLKVVKGLADRSRVDP